MAGETGFSDTSRAEGGSTDPSPAEGIAAMGAVSGFDTATVDRFHAGASQFKELAQQGKFAVNEDAMKAFIKVCDKFLKGWDHQRRNLELLVNPARMGSSDYARKVAEYNTKVASGDERSLIPNFELMADGYSKMREALSIARKNYNEADSEGDLSFNSFKLA